MRQHPTYHLFIKSILVIVFFSFLSANGESMMYWLNDQEAPHFVLAGPMDAEQDTSESEKESEKSKYDKIRNECKLEDLVVAGLLENHCSHSNLKANCPSEILTPPPDKA